MPPHIKKSYKHFMLNSQHLEAPQKNIAKARKANANIFCVAAVPKDSQRFSKAVCKARIFLCHLLPVGQWQSSASSKVKEPLQKWHSKVIAASRRTGASQKIAQKNCINASPNARGAIFYKFFLRFLLALRTCRQRLVAKHFLLHFIFYHN